MHFHASWIIAHLVGDYLLQNDWMAANKKRSTPHCLIHVSLYMVPFLVISFLPTTYLTWWQLDLIMAQHFIQDRTNFIGWFMRRAGQVQFSKPPMAPWSVIVVDNTFHLVWIYLVVIVPKLVGWV